MEKGFPNKPFEKLYEETPDFQELYSDLGERDKKVFRKSNLEAYPNGEKSFKSAFPKLFNHKLVTKASLLERCKHHNTDSKNNSPYNPNELPDLVKEISKLL